MAGGAAGVTWGVAFEQLIKSQFWKMRDLEIAKYFWFEPRVDSDGNTRLDGLNVTKVPTLFDLIKGPGGGTYPRPDFIVSSDRPTQDNADASLRPLGGVYERSWVIGDFKLRQQNVYDSMCKTQWQAIVNHASLLTQHQILPIALYVTLKGGDEVQEKLIEKRAFDSGALAVVISLF